MGVYYKGQEVSMNTMRDVISYIEVPEGQDINEINGLNSVSMTKDQFDELQDAVNYRTGEFGSKNVEELITSLKKRYMVNRQTEARQHCHPFGGGVCTLPLAGVSLRSNTCL